MTPGWRRWITNLLPYPCWAMNQLSAEQQKTEKATLQRG